MHIWLVYVTYFVAGLGLTAFLASIPQSLAEYISIVVGSIVVIGGLYEIKDYFWYGQGLSLMIPAKANLAKLYGEHVLKWSTYLQTKVFHASHAIRGS